MSLSLEMVWEAAQSLPEAERLALATRLLETLPEDGIAISVDDDLFVQELNRRFADSKDDVPWSQLRNEQ
jgi:hypothetical protein